MTEWATVDAYKLTKTEDGKYVLTGIELPAGAEVKVYDKTNDKWYPDLMDNYVVEEAGIYDLEFYPDGSVEGCYGGYFKLTKQEEPPVWLFDDVQDPEMYYFIPVYWAVDLGITDGMTDTTFVPGGNCTRAQVVTFLWRYANCPEPTITTCKFTDVSEDSWYYKAVLWAVEMGITDGMTDTTFEPETTCTRAQVVTFLWRFAKEPEPSSANNPFNDVKDGDWFYKAVLWAVEMGITDGVTETTFEPFTTCTRGQVVTFLYRYDQANKPQPATQITTPGCCELVWVPFVKFGIPSLM